MKKYVKVTVEVNENGDKKPLSIDFDGKIIAIEVLSAADETPGLGQNVAKLSFWEQFKNLSGETTVGGNVQAVTGATYSSKAVCECVNEALDLFDTITKEGEK